MGRHVATLNLTKAIFSLRHKPGQGHFSEVVVRSFCATLSFGGEFNMEALEWGLCRQRKTRRGGESVNSGVLQPLGTSHPL